MKEKKYKTIGMKNENRPKLASEFVIQSKNKKQLNYIFSYFFQHK